MTSMAHGLWNLLGHFWPKSNDAKRGKGGSPLVPKARWVQLSPFWPKIAKRNPGGQIGHTQQWAPLSTHGLSKPPGATRLGPESLPLNSGGDFSFIHVPCTKGSRHGAYML
ncbi:hypothetical protein O181_070574 [Austropuccinia psidii MF-1]|uniref:Uncharacterized protein n=1 Tax=Austropuccinia psidii MF-1 TaxID=1389203 RepID=A0A9Q3I9M2_9BASI|nr:hypothetical protein [Austropuccinia psidii MF-1]